MHIKVERGDSPDAGFETAAPLLAAGSVEASVVDASLLRMSLPLDETLAALSARIMALISAEAIAVYLLEGNRLAARYVHGENFGLLKSLRIPLGEGVAGWVAENHKPILNGDPALEPGYASGPRPPCELGSVLAVPLHTSSQTLGVLALYRAGHDAFSRDALERLLAANGQISLAVEGALDRQPARNLANVDALTGLPNPRALISNLEAEIAKRRDTGSALTLLYCGLEGMRDVHEAFGRLAAEEALRQVAKDFRASCQETEYLARFGVDDFVFVLPGLSAEGAMTRVEPLRLTVRQACLERWGSELLSLQAGAASYSWNGENPETFIAEAERRMPASRRTSDRASDQASDLELTSSMLG